jgi:hypothetical protein
MAIKRVLVILIVCAKQLRASRPCVGIGPVLCPSSYETWIHRTTQNFHETRRSAKSVKSSEKTVSEAYRATSSRQTRTRPSGER